MVLIGHRISVSAERHGKNCTVSDIEQEWIHILFT